MRISYTDGTIYETWARGQVYYQPFTLTQQFTAIKHDSTANLPHISTWSQHFPAYRLYFSTLDPWESGGSGLA